MFQYNNDFCMAIIMKNKKRKQQQIITKYNECMPNLAALCAKLNAENEFECSR